MNRKGGDEITMKETGGGNVGDGGCRRRRIRSNKIGVTDASSVRLVNCSFIL